jgi:uncharacterized integral membrane protein
MAGRGGAVTDIDRARATRKASANIGVSVSANVAEIAETVKAYAKQETVGPLRGLGRYLGFGLAGAACIAVGIILLAIGLLRLLQTETDTTFTGTLSWIPYLIVVVLLAVVTGLFAMRIAKKRSL